MWFLAHIATVNPKNRSCFRKPPMMRFCSTKNRTENSTNRQEMDNMMDNPWFNDGQ